MFGDGLPDLVELGATGRYWRNLGDGTFDEPRRTVSTPARLNLARPDVQLFDRDNILQSSRTGSG